MQYLLIDHTADFGVRVFGADLPGLFENAAHAMFDLITGGGNVEGDDELTVHVEGDDWPDLMVNWLRELLFLWNGRELLVSRVDIRSISEFELDAGVRYCDYDPDKHIIDNEIKAVTYHEIHVRKGSDGWESGIIFDV